MASTALFAGTCYVDRISHYIFAHLGLYFVDNGTNFLIEVLNRMISAANCIHRLEKSLGLETFQAKDLWFRHLCGM